jgi:hypothetical protein
MENIRPLAALCGFVGFFFGGLMLFNDEEGAAGLLLASAIIIAGVVIASAIHPALPRRPPHDPARGPAD